MLELANSVSLDFADDHGPVVPRHYAFGCSAIGLTSMQEV